MKNIRRDILAAAVLLPLALASCKKAQPYSPDAVTDGGQTPTETAVEQDTGSPIRIVSTMDEENTTKNDSDTPE